MAKYGRKKTLPPTEKEEFFGKRRIQNYNQSGYTTKWYHNPKLQSKRRMGAQLIKTWSLMNQSLRNKFGIENHERQRQGKAKEKFMESLMGEMSAKANELSKGQDVIDRKISDHEKKNTCTFVKEEKSRKEK
ncbi:hypothetical protein M9H77_02393 [Catharanthus roseus]|uniref:Uncharacterized protein n=1 Tax=Catharanthus roseus TaxID=4058 RepID=A0ACC0C8A5_CATRO|nr:hypothetical protein M9H77_02393 [Catharanthus roseus]